VSREEMQEEMQMMVRDLCKTYLFELQSKVEERFTVIEMAQSRIGQ
jgi:hypothetical protein